MRIFGFEITRVKKESMADRPRLGPVKPTPQSPARWTEEQLLFRVIARDKCPNCGSDKGFFEGPRGGISMNIKCANPPCGAKFNVTPALEIAERI